MCSANRFVTSGGVDELQADPGAQQFVGQVRTAALPRPELVAPKLEMFTRRRLDWTKPQDLPQFDGMPG